MRQYPQIFFERDIKSYCAYGPWKIFRSVENFYKKCIFSL